ncbi:MAG: hypothetical protein JW976_08205 [Syntrophaceae bacterium]|nr:hypothetical protein [Syntrophaceae bacterium]
MSLKIRIFFIFVIILIPQLSMASAPGSTYVYGVTIHLMNGEKLNGYIETDWGGFNACNENKGDKATWESFLEGQRLEGTDDHSVRFINKLIPIKINKRFSPYAAKSSVKKIKVKDIRSIEGVCKDWDGYTTMMGIQIISDYMTKYMSNHSLVAEYIYDEAALLEAGKMKEDCGLCSCITTYLSYNSDYTRERLKKLRKKIDKMSDIALDKENIIKFTECSD